MSIQKSARPGSGKPSHWTVQFMPDGVGRVRSFRVSRRTVVAAGVAVAAFLMLVVGFVASLSVDMIRETELIRLRMENRHLSQNLSEIQGQVALLSQSVDALSAKDQRLRLLAGLPYLDEDVRAVGVGGPLNARAEREEFFEVAPEVAQRTYAAAYDADQLVRRVELLTSSIDEAMDSVAVHREIFLARPSIQPVQSGEAWISSSFSHSRYHPVLQYDRPHPGIDISAHSGSPILATARGVVTYAGSKAGYGKTIEVDHGHGYKTRYAHMGSISVKRGQRVKRGEVLGGVGKTGLATAPHLHYEVLVNGRAVNPREFLLDDVLYE